MSAASEAVPSVQQKSSAVIANRVAGALAWAGVFIAAVLTYSHWAEKAVPCGASRGCDTIAQHASSKWFGVPVAVIGLVGYLILVGLAVARPVFGKPKWRRLVNVSVAGTAFGFLASVYFMYESLVHIKATCMWCIASAIVMTASFIVTGWLWSCEDPEVAPERADSLVHVGGAVLALGLTTVVALGMDRALDVSQPTIGSLTESQILPDKAKIRGSMEAKVKVIEFADFNCPACRSSSPEMDEMFRKANGKLLWAFRNMPLVEIKGHETSMHAATLSELAATKGRFWTFFDNVFDPNNTERIKGVDGLKQVAMESGLAIDDINAALTQTSPEAKAVAADIDLSLRLSIDQTPVFLILAEGVEPRAVSGRRLKTVLHESPYKEMLWE